MKLSKGKECLTESTSKTDLLNKNSDSNEKINLGKEMGSRPVTQNQTKTLFRTHLDPTYSSMNKRRNGTMKKQSTLFTRIENKPIFKIQSTGKQIQASSDMSNYYAQ